MSYHSKNYRLQIKKSLTRYVNIKQYIIIIFLILFYKMYEYHNNYNVAFELLYPNYLPKYYAHC